MAEAAHTNKSFLARAIGERRLRSSPGQNHRNAERKEQQNCSDLTAAALRNFYQAHSLLISFPPVTVGRSARPLRIYVVFKRSRPSR